MNAMSTNYIHIDTINNGNKDLTINVPPGTDISKLIHTFMTDSAEDVTTDETSSSPAATNESQEIEEFKYIHVEVTDPAERTQIHRMMCNIVRLPRMQQG